MKTQIFSVIQIILAIALMVLILLQAKGTGLGSTFGGEIGLYRTKRGLEKIFFRLTIFVSTLFIILSVIGLVV